MSALNIPLILQAILEEYELPWDGDHGIAHWARVLENGVRLACETGPDVEVVRLFAIFHDSRRVNEASDPDHRPSRRRMCRELRGSMFDLPDAAFRLLHRACAGHTHERTDPDVTIRTCWDSDRLDLGRVGITPHPSRLCTDAAQEAGDDRLGRRQGDARRGAGVRQHGVGARAGAASAAPVVVMPGNPVGSFGAVQRLQQRADCRPELLLDLDGDGVLKPVGCLATCLLRGEDADGEFSVRVVPVAAPVPSQDGRSDPGDLEQFGQPPALAEIGEEPVSLGVDVRTDVVGDLAGPVAQTDASVESHGADPEGSPPRPSSVEFQNRTWWRRLALAPTGFSKARSCFRPKTNRLLTGASA